MSGSPNADLSKPLKKVRGPSWKKILWRGALVVSLLGAAVVYLLCVLSRRDPKGTMSGVVRHVQHRVDQIDIEAKVRVAQANGVEQQVIDKITTAADIRDPRERLQALAAALADDY